MKDHKIFSDFTEVEFLEFITSITDPADDVSEKELDLRILIFKEITEHPSGSDLIYWPEADGLDTPEEILRIVKEWRASNEKPGLKAPQVPVLSCATVRKSSAARAAHRG